MRTNTDYKISGCIYVKSGRYYARINYYVDGKRKCKNYPTGVAVDDSSPRKAKQAEQAAQRVLAKLLDDFTIPVKVSNKPDRSKQQFSELVLEWLERQKGSKPPSTVAGYTICVNDIVCYFTKIRPIRTVEMSATVVEDYLAWERRRREPGYQGPFARKPISPDGAGIENTVLHRATTLRSILQFAKREGIILTNFASKQDCNVELPTPQDYEPTILTPEEADRFVERLKNEPLWFIVAVLLALTIGPRRSEVIGLREKDIDFSANQITIRNVVTQQPVNGKTVLTSRVKTKGKKAKQLCLSDNLDDDLRRGLQMLIQANRDNAELFGEQYDHEWDGYVFRYPDGKLIQPNTLTQRFSRFSKEVGIKEIRFHDLRHSCASIMHANGVNLRTIQGVLGHAQLTTTSRYTHLYSDDLIAATDYMSVRYSQKGLLPSPGQNG